MSPIKTLTLRIACDGESASGKSFASKTIAKKYKLFCMNSGLLFRYASRLIIKHKPKKIILFLRKKFINLNYKHITRLDLHSQVIEYLRAMGWAVTASIGFSLGVAIAIFIFNKLTEIDEWQEIKNGNMGVALIEVALIVMIGLIVYKVI